MFKLILVLLFSIFISGCDDSESGKIGTWSRLGNWFGLYSPVYNQGESKACYRLLLYKNLSTGAIKGSCQVYEIHDENSEAQCSAWENKSQLCWHGMPVGNFDWETAHASAWQDISLPTAEISGEQAKCIFDRIDSACYPYTGVSSTSSTAVSQTGTQSGTQAIGGCEWGFGC